ncbi:MAG: CCC motif membrane protein [Flavipsychrobacter sp.]
MTENNYSEQQQLNQRQIALPNATAVLVLGIVSILLCCCYGGGLVTSIIALLLAGKDTNRYIANPAMYTPGSYSNLKAGKICAIIAIIFSLMYIALAAWFILTFGWETMQDPNAMREAMEQWAK